MAYLRISCGVTVNLTIPVKLIENWCHDRLVEQTIITEQKNLTPAELAAEVRRLTATPGRMGGPGAA